MFGQLNPAASRHRFPLWTSLSVHAILLAWLLHEPEPMLINPVSVALGHNGRAVTRLYWANQSPDDSTHSSSDTATERYRRQRLAQAKTRWKTPTEQAKLTTPSPAPAEVEDKAKAQTLSAAGHGVQAGLSYGTLTRGQLYGEEIRPALPVATSDPVTYPWELPDSEGNVVVEITIDERGEIVSKTVLQSLGANLDGKVLVALDNWHFHPATRNGAPIPSKQDAIFHFRARG